MQVTGKTLQLGVIGHPIEHSFSPQMHNFIAEQMGEDYIYNAYHVLPESLPDAIRGMRAFGIAGINVTAPHKIAVMNELDEISPQAKLLGSVNTVVNRDGILTGYNTDGDGFYMALKNSGIDVTDSKMLVFGCGGVVKPTLTRLIQEKPESITVLNRSMDKARLLSDEIFKSTGFRIKTEVTDFDFDLVINTTSAGMAPQLDALPTDSIVGLSGINFISSKTAVVDMIYNPSETRFLKEARIRGAKTLNGLDMLIYQGIIANELFCDRPLPDDMAERIRKEVFLR